MLLHNMGADESPKQVANVAQMPGIVKYSLAMPDMHWGYGFPIGGVAAFDIESGVISPGGVGYDINCGCRLVQTRLDYGDIKEVLPQLLNELFLAIPAGVGSTGPIRLSAKEVRKVLERGSRWAVENGYGEQTDLDTTEDQGHMQGADPGCLSDRAIERGREQLGTLGSGNHFLEIEIVEEIFDSEAADIMGIIMGQVNILIHSGSRGLGYQVCDDYLARMVREMNSAGFNLPDRQLACAYINSDAGREYFGAMCAAANYAWANRQMLMHWTRECFEKFLHKSSHELGMRLLYDICHNIAKLEEVPVDGKMRKLCIHRKGATRSFPPGHPVVPDDYKKTGQPVLIPGDMGSGSYILKGTQKAFEETFGSTCHGAGRVMSRTQAVKASKGRAIRREMEDRGVLVMASGRGTLMEEIPEAYKNIHEVVNVVHKAGLSQKVARLRAVACIKG